MTKIPCAISIYYNLWKNNRKEEKFNKLVNNVKPGDLIFFDLDMDKTLPGKWGGN